MPDPKRYPRRRFVEALVNAEMGFGDLATEVGVHPKTVLRWAQATRNPSGRKLADIEGLIGISATDFYTEDAA